MSKPSNFGPSFDLDDAIGNILDVAARFCLYGGAGLLVVGTGFLSFYFMHFSQSGVNPSGAGNIDLFKTLSVVGALAAGGGSMYLFWGEEFLIPIQIIVSCVLWFSPMYFPVVFGIATPTEPSGRAVGDIQTSGTLLGGIAILGLLAEILLRIRVRMMQGARSEQMKFGRGVVEEKHQNQFMGKCWQLPFCRKFVRERCPIFHAKRTCWKERVGCMCEEEVIQNAMQNKAIPKDAIAAARYIPVNNRITMSQKVARCKQCVIYNEHLKHKYKLAVPITIATFILMYIVFRGTMLGMSEMAINRINGVVGDVSMGQAKIQQEGVAIFREVLVDCFMFVLLAYILKLLEFVIFKLKV
jgi:hypothetical protein